MPLKNVVRPLLVQECATSTQTGAVNTVVRGADGWEGFNTDVWGAPPPFRHQSDMDFGVLSCWELGQLPHLSLWRFAISASNRW